MNSMTHALLLPKYAPIHETKFEITCSYTFCKKENCWTSEKGFVPDINVIIKTVFKNMLILIQNHNQISSSSKLLYLSLRF